METQPIGLVISKIIKDKRISKTELATKLNISRQAIYNLPTRDSLTLDEIEQWAMAIGVTSQYIIDNSKQGIKVNVDTSKEGDGYLMRYITQLENQNSKLNEDLTKALDTIRELVGKSDNVLIARFAAMALFFMGYCDKFGYIIFS